MNPKEETQNKQQKPEQEETDVEKNGSENVDKNEEIDNSNEEIDNSDELEQKKREANEFNADNNRAENQIFIQDMGTGGFTVNYYAQKSVPVISDLPVKEKFDLRKQEDCIHFIEAFKNTEFFLTAVILCVFDAVPLSDLPALISVLVRCLPAEEPSDPEEPGSLKKDPFLAVNSILTVIGGEVFKTETGKQCISMGENHAQALIHVLEQFPALQESVSKFIVQITETDQYHTAFYDHQVALFLVEMTALHVMDVENKILPILYEKSHNMNLLAVYVYRLLFDRSRQETADVLIYQWLQSDIEWMWKAVCYCFALFHENNRPFEQEQQLKKMLQNKILNFRAGDLNFIAELSMQAICFRDLICNVIGNKYRRLESNSNRKRLAQLYVNLIREGYYRVSASFMALPFVACDTKTQQECLTPILEKVMTEYRFRKQIYAILKAYLKEVSQYNYSDKLINHIAAYVYNLSLAGQEYKEDLMDFLKGCHCKASKQILDLF